MAYVDVDKFAEAICDFKAIDDNAADEMIWFLRTFPAADVAPKSEVDYWKQQCFYACMSDGRLDINALKNEVAREIFAEIEKGMVKVRVENFTNYVLSAKRFAELKKKYTEGEG